MFQLALKTLREKRGLTQTALAKALGVSQSTVGMWEAGRNKPTFAALTKLAEVLNVPTSYFWDTSERHPVSGKPLGFIRMEDSSMAPLIMEGDTLTILPANEITSCSVMALKKGYTTYVRRVFKAEKGYVAAALDPQISPLVFTDADIKAKRVKIIGDVLELKRAVL